MPSFNLPSKILCKVIHIHHRQNNCWFGVTYFSVLDYDGTIPDTPVQEPEKCTTCFLETTPTDLHNNEWHFWHIFLKVVTTGQPRRHLLTTGQVGHHFIFGVRRHMRQQTNIPFVEDGFDHPTRPEE
ncbi:BnaCnng47450D [Brassica napus]|uniref:(rape) hypothetical protein n=1 Tax=Brassica napus TaxID=3708 RepID=A0A078JG97_BRANA|nr:unnamed protein product [Brassica napus]CDY65525.1 BnaCnng47450D [Brassica napus]